MTREEFNALKPGFYWIKNRFNAKTIMQVYPADRTSEVFAHVVGATNRLSDPALIDLLGPVEGPPRTYKRAVIEVLVDAEDDGTAGEYMADALAKIMDNEEFHSPVKNWRYAPYDLTQPNWKDDTGEGWD